MSLPKSTSGFSLNILIRSRRTVDYHSELFRLANSF